MISFEVATKNDSEDLVKVQIEAFNDESKTFNNKDCGGPPGYDSIEWQTQMMEYSKYFKIVFNGEIIGGIIIFEEDNFVYNLGRIFIDPRYQNKGFGMQAMKYIKEHFQKARKWWLGTPKWSVKNHYFYEKCGYIRVGEEGDDGLLYEMTINRN